MSAPRFVAGLLLIVLSILVTVSLVTFNREDIARVRAEGALTPRVENAGGTLGVFVSHYLRSWVGLIPQYVLPFLMLLWGIHRLLGRSPARLLAWSSLLLALGAGVALVRSLPY